MHPCLILWLFSRLLYSFYLQGVQGDCGEGSAGQRASVPRGEGRDGGVREGAPQDLRQRARDHQHEWPRRKVSVITIFPGQPVKILWKFLFSLASSRFYYKNKNVALT